MDDARSTRMFGMAIGVLGPVLVAAALVAVRDDVEGANLALILVLVVVLAAVTGGWQAGAVAGVTSAVAFDFFLTQPYLSLTIDSQDDVETAILLLIVGVSVGIIAGRARVAVAAARRGSSEIERIHRVAELAAQGARSEDVLLEAQTQLSELLELKECRFEAPPFGVPLARIERNGTVTGTSTRHYAGGELELPRDGVEMPVLARGQQIGRFVLEPAPGVGVSLESRVVAVAIADQVGAALTSPVQG